MELDSSQNTAKITIENSVVSAGAGSGKTRVLAERFAYLVTEKGYKVDQILTLTFTKKATVEMKSRIFTTLKEAADNGNDLAKEAVLDFNKAQIMTLDSYFSYIARQGSRFYGVSPSFGTENDESWKKIHDMAIPFLLENRDNIAVKEAGLVLNNPEDVADQLFVNPVLEHSHPSSKIDFRRDLEKQAEIISSVWEETWCDIDKLVSVMEKEFIDLNTPPFKTKSAENLDDAFTAYNSAKIVPLSKEDILKCNISDAVKSIESKLLKFCNMKKPTGKNISEILGENFTAVPGKAATLFHLLNFASGIETTKASIQLLEQFQEKVLLSKRTEGVLTHGDVSQMAYDILKDHPEIRAMEKAKYREIMIDEFQDNNSLQRDILFMLAEKKERNTKGIPDPLKGEIYTDKLFFVGDEKQSIYKFRGADVSVFNSLKNIIKDSDGKNLYMGTNYRSAAELIAGFNTIFGGSSYPPVEDEKATENPSVFLKANGKDHVPEFEAAYSTVYANPDKVKTADYTKKRIHVALARNITEEDEDFAKQNKFEYLSTTEAEADWVARKIRNLLDTNKYKASDIAILFRKTTHLPQFERALLQYGIPYSTESRKGFFSDGPVNDLFSFLSVCIYPRDMNFYAKLLCSPFVGLSLVETAAVISREKVPFKDGSEDVLAGTSREKFLKMKNLYDEISKSCRTELITTTLTKLWGNTGYKYETMWNKKVQMYRTTFDILFEMARQCDMDGMSLSDFLDQIKIYQDEAVKLDGIDVPLEAKDSVNIMTIHKSKGLEFKVVFSVNSESGAKGRNQEESKRMLYYTPKAGMSFRTKNFNGLDDRITKKAFSDLIGGNYFYKKAEEENKKTECAELRRLGYVSFTRAIDELFISGSLNDYNESKASAYLPQDDSYSSKSILEQMTPVISFYRKKNENDDSDDETFEMREESPFDVEVIDKTIRSASANHNEDTDKNESRANVPAEKISFAKSITETNSCKKIIHKDEVQPVYIKPSKLHAMDDETYTKPEEYRYEKDAPYPIINELIKKSAKIKEKNEDGRPAFNAADFGTIAHAYLEGKILGKIPVISESNISGLRGIKEDIDALEKVCEEIADKFMESSLGKEARDSEWKRAEYGFKSRFNGSIAYGSMDLVFKNKDSDNYRYTIVDYKTNQTIDPEIYREQLSCYRDALAKILGIKTEEIRCVLYYLRFGQEVEIS